MGSPPDAVSTDVNQRVRDLLANQYKRLETREPVLLRGRDPEALHDFRVAIRRMRTLLGECKPYLESSLSDCRTELGWLGLQTSTIRDADVLLQCSPGYVEVLESAVRVELVPLCDHLVSWQQEQADTLRQLLAGPRYLQLKTTLNGLIRGDALLVDEESARIPLELIISKVTSKALRRVLKQGETIRPTSPDDDLHRLRKSGKKLRYLLEFFSDYYPAPVIQACVGELKHLQDHLGRFQDLSVQPGYLRVLASEMSAAGQFPPATAAALESLQLELQRQKTASRTASAERFRDFRQQALEHCWLAQLDKGSIEHGS